MNGFFQEKCEQLKLELDLARQAYRDLYTHSTFLFFAALIGWSVVVVQAIVGGPC
jgi:hypothetical protein